MIYHCLGAALQPGSDPEVGAAGSPTPSQLHSCCPFPPHPSSVSQMAPIKGLCFVSIFPKISLAVWSSLCLVSTGCGQAWFMSVPVSFLMGFKSQLVESLAPLVLGLGG
jgi:ABC-type nitrate/sulfonate/bicarbonate transport system permease component